MSDSMLKVLVVEPMKPCELREIPDTLEAMQQTVGGHIESVSFEGEAIVCNESGKILGLPYNRPLLDESGLIPLDILHGTFFIAGVSGESFVSLTDAQVQRYKELYDNVMIVTAVRDQPAQEKPAEKGKIPSGRHRSEAER